jgi:hypothetical protein
VLQLQKQIEQENLAQVVAYDHLPTDIEKSIPTNFSGTQTRKPGTSRSL